MEGMKRYPDKHFELAIVDPPYGIGNFNQSDSLQGKVLWNDKIPSQDYFKEICRVSRNQIIWGANYYNCFHPGGAIVWHKGPSKDCYSECELASLSFQKKVDFVSIMWQSGFYRANIEDIIHPTQKPVKLYEWLLKNYAKQGDKILDTHLGSGSIAIACYNLDFDLTGFEIDKDYYDAACNRLENHKKQQRLFDGITVGGI
jgi:site-specific DNA-methyltransferase (adenine-specific)